MDVFELISVVVLFCRWYQEWCRIGYRFRSPCVKRM